MAERGQRHPLKWRALSWVIIDVDAFLLGFGAGAVVAYNFLARWSQEAQEGMSIFVVLIIEAMLPATVVLGIAWVRQWRGREAPRSSRTTCSSSRLGLANPRFRGRPGDRRQMVAAVVRRSIAAS